MTTRRSISALFPTLILAALVLAILVATPAAAQVLDFGELTSREIEALDRDKTVVLIPGGLMEQHGPYLPAYTDGYVSGWLAQRLADRLVERPGWTVVIHPTINVGSGSANVIGGRTRFPGSFDVRTETLRDVFMDLATALGEQGFRWIFPIHLHGYPAHNRALDTAGDYFHDTYGGHMVNLMGLMPVIGCCATQAERFLSDEERAQNGFSVHAGVEETSHLLFVRPDLVEPERRQAPDWTGEDFADLVRLAADPKWPGYFGAPRHASAALGAARLRERSEITGDLAIRILDDLDYRKIPRYADVMAQAPPIAGIIAGVEAYERRVARQQREWLEGRAKKASREAP